MVSFRVLIAGGGTGGHLFPGLAIAAALRRQAPGCGIRFVGSRHGIEHRIVPGQGYRLHRLAVRGLVGISWAARIPRLILLPWAFLQCLWILLAYRPHLVIGVGGYASGPMVATALLLGRRCVLQEQNASPGLTNRMLGRWVKHAFLAVEDRQGFFPRATVTGNPVRPEMLALREAGDSAPREGAPLLFVFGGSQGARVLNRAMTEALPRLAAWGRPLRILHQTGAAELEAVRSAYAELPSEGPLQAEAAPFIDNMAEAYREARLVVGRAGASTVSEILAARRAAVLVPIPGSSGNHQLRNAERLAEAGAALVIEQARLTGDTLADTVLGLLADPARIEAMENSTDTLFAGDAADAIARQCLDMMQ